MLIKIGAGLLAGVLGLGVAGGVAVQQYGFAIIEVEEKHVGGEHLYIPVPLALARVAASFIPKDELGHVGDEDLIFASRLAAAVTDELEEYPDVVFFELNSPNEEVRIRTRNGELEVFVEDQSDRVHIRVPLWGARQLLEVLAD